MRFDLTPEVIDQIIFSMENQESPFVFDSETGTVVEASSSVDSHSDEKNEEGEIGFARYVDIPEWSSADGFQLMERFVATLRNPPVREKLRAALAGGKGVFRNFKNALKEHEEVERLWFSFKDREMHAKVIDWYNDLCDLWGWQRLGREPDQEEETEELVLSDFEFGEEGAGGADLVRTYDQEAWEEAHAAVPPAVAAALYARARAGVDPAASNSLIISARTPGGDLAGFIWGVEEGTEEEDGGPPTTAWLGVAQMYVTKEFRGLGISRALIDHLCRIAYSHGVHKVLIELFGSAEFLLEPLADAGFSPISHRLMLDVEEWGLENAER